MDAVCVLPTVIGIARQVEVLGLVICLNAVPVGWPAALKLSDACRIVRCHRWVRHRPRPGGDAGA